MRSAHGSWTKGCNRSPASVLPSPCRLGLRVAKLDIHDGSIN